MTRFLLLLIVALLVSAPTADPVADGLSAFRTAGLHPPDVEVEIHDDWAACNGAMGLHFGGEGRVHVCVRDPNVLMHELAHAWIGQNFSDHDGYLALRSLDVWHDMDVPSLERGTEDAARTLSWGLTGFPRYHLWTTESDLADRIAAFEYLTGMAPPVLAD